MRFGYLRDPLFVACLILYGLNRCYIRQWPHADFFHAHFNDLICVPFLLPLALVALRVCRLRGHDGPPLAHEVVTAVVVWSILFEMVFPRMDGWSGWTFGDPDDVLCYAISGCGAMCFWSFWYRCGRGVGPQ